ncbi:MAG: dimethyl sulfoxide reductase anchor subunit, partial [Candidatus Krumholzibacteria bacterium]|nr:dimethyl sulfoxide reductase anchor subunit [Candidatus Krumholzibacteria bacterium]
GMALSTIHLGRRARAWRAALNWRRAWLSREVLLYPAFLVVGTVTLFSDQNGDVVGWLVALVGFAALFSMDRVYHVTRVGGLWSHSAQVLPTGLLFAGLFSANVVLFGLLASVKTLLYLRRKYRLAKLNRDSGPWLTRGRVLIGVAVPLAMWSTGSPALYPAVVAGVLVGELIDRCEFYGELDAPAPSRQMASDLAAVVHGLDTKTETDA